MRLVEIRIDQAIGGVLLHNIADAQGHKAFAKGHRLVESDIAKLRALGKTTVLVGMFEDGDVSENDAAARVAHAVTGANLTATPIGTGRVNFFANARGILKVNDAALAAINALDGITIATIPANTVVAAKKMVATIKTIGLAVPENTVQQAAQIAHANGGVLSVRVLPNARVAVILSGSAEARARVEKTFLPAIQGRVEDLGAQVVAHEFVAHEEHAIAAALERAKNLNADCVILAGETSIMDLSDVTPSGIVRAGGTIELYGAPVEPGNLLLLAYANDLPIVGAPGCVKSRDTNVVDLILPRLLAGERVGKKEIVALANGGLLI
jgi:molybdenum cofactor cytidylyltransferase